MKQKKDKVVIVGAGAVGTSIAFDLCIQGVCHEIVLIDINYEKAWTEAADIQQGGVYQHRNVKIHAGSYADCGNADLVIITAAAPYVDGQRRLDMVDSAAQIIRSIVPPIMESGFNGIFVVVTNPVDVMAYLVYQLSGLPARQVIGTGTSLDSARLRGMIADLLQVDAKSVQAYTIGEHGDSQIIPWSQVTIGGKSFADMVEDHKAQLADVNEDQLLRDVKEVAFKVGRLKRTTNFAIAAVVTAMVKIILNDENTVIPVSTLLQGEFGEHDVFAGVPAVLNRQGVKEIVELRLRTEELEGFKKSVALIREYNKGMKRNLKYRQYQH